MAKGKGKSYGDTAKIPQNDFSVYLPDQER
jgi:hypothetical protein